MAHFGADIAVGLADGGLQIRQCQGFVFHLDADVPHGLAQVRLLKIVIQGLLQIGGRQLHQPFAGFGVPSGATFGNGGTGCGHKQSRCKNGGHKCAGRSGKKRRRVVLMLDSHWRLLQL